MEYKKYGRTDKMVSSVGLGGMRFKDSHDIDGSAQTMIEAFNMGVNYFDTAPGYFGGRSEEIFGRAFKQLKRDKFYVSTKCGLWNAKTADEMQKVLETSLKRMNVDKIDFYNCWCMQTMEDYKAFMKKGGVYDGIVKARDQGLVGHVCFTTHMAGSDIAKVVADDVFEGVTLGYNAINFAYRQEGVEAAAKAGIGIMTMNPLGGGIIPQHPDYFSFLKKGGDSLVVSALKFITSQPYITVALAGMGSIEEAKECVLAGQNFYDITPDYFETMQKYLNEQLNTLCTGCTYCDHCPQGIEVPKFMDGFNEYILSNEEDKILERLKGHWDVDKNHADNCIECGECERLCTQKLPIIKRLKFISEIKEG